MLTVLIPVDSSKSASNAIRYALQLSKVIDSKFIFFHSEVIPTPITSDAAVLPVQIDEATIRENLSSNVERIFESLKITPDPNQISYKIADGFSIGTSILDAVEKLKPDLIIMGTAGASGLKKVLMGSNVVDVISRANVPVLAVPETYDFKPVEKILHASDLRQLNDELHVVIPWAELFDATIEVAHISDVTEEDEERITKAQNEIERKSYKKINLFTESITFGRSLSDDLKRLMARHHPDMVIMFRHEHNWLGRLFMISHTDQIAFETRVPLLAINMKKKQ